LYPEIGYGTGKAGKFNKYDLQMFLDILNSAMRLKWLACALWYAGTIAAQPATLQDRLDKLLGDDFFQQATAGVAVYDLTGQKPVYACNERRLCRPASNMKLLTSATALSALTPGYTFKTGLYYTGTIDESGRLLGDIYLAGGFDPELKSADLDSLILQVKKAGIGSIDGNLYLDASMADSTFWGKAWSWDDDMEAFQPYLSPIPLNKGVVKLTVVPASPGRAPIIKTEPESSFIQVVNRAVTTWKSSEPPQKTLHITREYSSGGYNRIVVSGVISASDAYHTAISLKNPYGYALTLFSEKLSEQIPGSNIRVAGMSHVPDDAVKLGDAAHSMAEVVRQLNKESDNLNAEMLLYALGYRQDNGPSSTGKGIAAVQQFIAQMGLNPKTYSIVDGSGLSNQNYLTPELLVAVLKHMYRSPCFELFRESLPIAGEDGTLAHRMRNSAAYRKVTAKTGSITGVSALSGYVTARNGHLFAFSIMIQNFVEKTSYVSVNYIDRICEALAE
jgi:D-alanyl-D-alanine carboxypeptidase/D-alanyl-D-alanine-endopeptidase (penicillin-binding protein 4)